MEIATVSVTIVVGAALVATALPAFEIMAAAAVLLGLGVAFGALDRRPSARRRHGTIASAPQNLSTEVRDALAALDPVEHHRFDLGDPWPTVVVGPTGVTVIAVAVTTGSQVLARLGAVVDEVRSLVASTPDAQEVPVAGLLVVAHAGAVRGLGGGLRAITADQLADALARGPLVPMSIVGTIFARLSGTLAPDLREVP